jgi:hypothetical protein
VAYSNQLAKLKYSTEISNAIQRARDSLEGMPAAERGRLELFINEMAIRAEEEVNPPEQGQIATRVNQFAFVMLLTGAASAATQMASVPIMVMPTLSQEYGPGKAGAQFIKMSAIYKSVGVTQKDTETGNITYTAPSLASSRMAKDDPNLNRAFQEAIEKYNLFSLTNTSVINNTQKTPESASEGALGATTRFAVNTMSALFTGSERISREITFAMTFNLEFAKTGNFDGAVQKAVAVTNETLGRYDNQARPRILRNSFGRTVGQFKMYSVFQTSWFVRNATTVFREGLLASEGRAAMERLSGVLIMGGLFHGLVGMPMYSLICDTIDVVLDTFGDEEEKEERRLSNPLTASNSNLRFRQFLEDNFGEITMPGLDNRQHSLAEVLEKGPISALTDINIGSRTSFDGMWWRDAKPSNTVTEAVLNNLIANLGPGVSTGINVIGGIEDLYNGEIQRGLEKLVPAFFRGSLVASRLAEEGAETRGGTKLLERSEINDLNLIAATLGYQSTRIARIQESNFAYKKEMVEADKKRDALIRNFNNIVLDDTVDEAKLAKALENISKHNQRYPAKRYAILPGTLSKSLENAAKKRGRTIRGQYMPEDLAPYLAPATRAVTPIVSR